MIDQKIESRAGFPVAALLLLLLAVSLAVLTYTRAEIEVAIFAVLPFCLTIALFLTRRKKFHATFTPTSLEVGTPPHTIPFAEMRTVMGVGRPANPFKTGPRHYAIQVVHSGGTLWIPARLNVPSDEVYLFLYRHFSVKGSSMVNPTLADYLKRKVKEFGADRVWSYCAREHRGRVRNLRRSRAVSAALVAAGAFWILAGVLKGPQSPLIPLGFVLLLFGGLFSLLFWLFQRPLVSIPDWKKASLIISPAGLVLLQGDLRGQLRWDEVLEVKLIKRMGVRIKVAGALLVVADIYDRPINLIYQQICYYWRGEPTDTEAERIWKRSEEPALEVPPNDLPMI